MPLSRIETLTQTAGNDQDYKQVTGSPQWGNKQALDVAVKDAGVACSAFGEQLVVQITPVVQIDAVYGLREGFDSETFVGPAGGVADIYDSGTSSEFHCGSGTATGGFGLIRSERSIRYRPGQGVNTRFTARYGTPQALGSQRAGLFGRGNELSFGYNGTEFGLLHRTGGRQDVHTLTMTTGAGGAENFTVTLAGVAFNFTATAGTTDHASFEIAAESYTAWSADYNDSVITFVSSTDGDKAGTYSFASDGTAAGTFAEARAGNDSIDHWVPQTEWNGFTLLDTATSPFVLDTTKGNVFQIQFQYLGYGGVFFHVENPADGHWVLIHTLQNANTRVTPTIDVPIFNVGWFTANLGNATEVDVYGGSCTASIEGKVEHTRHRAAQVNSKTGVGTTFTNILTIKNRSTFQNKLNLNELIINEIAYACEGTKPVEIVIILDAELGGEPNWEYIDEASSVVEFDTAGTTVTIGAASSRVGAYALGRTGDDIVKFGSNEIHLNGRQTFTLAARATATTTDVTASIAWIED